MMPMASAGASSALSMMTMSVPTAGAMLHLLFHLFHPLPVAPHNIPYMFYPIEIHLQLIDLSQYIVKSRNLGISYRNRIPGPIVLLLRHHLRLLGEIV
jgi:hypothetical protein